MGKYLEMIDIAGLVVVREQVPEGILFGAYVPDDCKHSFTIQSGGRRLGMVGTQELPEGVVAGPMAGTSWRALQATVAHRAILCVHPELREMRVEARGPALVVREECA